MILLAVKIGESFMIGGSITVRVLAIDEQQVTIRIEAPSSVSVRAQGSAFENLTNVTEHKARMC